MCVGRVDRSSLSFRFSLHRHSCISLLFDSQILVFHTTQFMFSCHVRSDVSLTSPDVRPQVIWRRWRKWGRYNSFKIRFIHFKFCSPSSSQTPRKQGTSHIQLSSNCLSEKFIWRNAWRDPAEMMHNKGLQEDDIQKLHKTATEQLNDQELLLSTISSLDLSRKHSRGWDKEC